MQKRSHQVSACGSRYPSAQVKSYTHDNLNGIASSRAEGSRWGESSHRRHTVCIPPHQWRRRCSRTFRSRWHGHAI